MRLFNSFQIVAVFVVWLFGIAWLSDASFKGATAALIAACALYVVAFGAMVASVYSSTEEWKF